MFAADERIPGHPHHEGETLRGALGLSAPQAAAALAAARQIASAGGAVGERTRGLLALAAQTLGVTEPPGAGSTDEGELARLFPSAAERRWLLDALILVVCIEGGVNPARRQALEALARGLGVRSPFVEMVRAFEGRRLLAIKRGLATRSPDAQRMFRRIWSEEGALGVLRAGWFVLGFHRDPALAGRFRALASLPEGTFGRAVADHFAARGIAFPGEAGGVPERMMHHDLMHVLNGYDTDPAGECELAGFYCGFTGGEPFTFLMTALATFHLGLRVSPAVVTPSQGAFDPPRVLAAFLRGRRLAVDVMGAWDYWSLMGLPIDEVRARLGIGDRGARAVNPEARAA